MCECVWTDQHSDFSFSFSFPLSSILTNLSGVQHREIQRMKEMGKVERMVKEYKRGDERESVCVSEGILKSWRKI